MTLPRGADYSLTENATTPFQAEPTHNHRHEVLFSSNDGDLLESLTSFVTSELSLGNAAIILVTEPRPASLVRRLHGERAEIQDAMQRGTSILLDAGPTPDPPRVLEAVTASSEAAAKAGRTVRVLPFSVTVQVVCGPRESRRGNSDRTTLQ